MKDETLSARWWSHGHVEIMESLGRTWGDRFYPIFICRNKLNHMFAPQCMGSWADEITTKCTSLRHKSKYIRQITAGLCDILPIHALVGVSNPSAKMSVYLCVI